MKSPIDPPPSVRPQQLLLQGKISPMEAIPLLIDPAGTIDFAAIDPQVIDRFWKSLANIREQFQLIPLFLWQGTYYIASPNVLTEESIELLVDRLDSKIYIINISTESYREYLRQQNLKAATTISTKIDIRNSDLGGNVGNVAKLHLANASDQEERIVVLLTNALRSRTSDIHLEPTLEGLRVRYRIDGVLQPVIFLPVEIGRKVIVALKVMAELDIAESRRPQDGRIAKQYMSDNDRSAKLDMRVSTMPCVNGEKIVIRLLPQDNPFSTLDKLGFMPDALELYTSWLNQPQGMIVLTGPTGSGKTSTLYTSLQAIATDGVNVATVEDPVEYVLRNITQTQVNPLAGMTFESALRALMRQDPDIILVGETRDKETAETAVRAALTGHLVLTTLHTNDAAGAIPRLRNIGPDPAMIVDALLGVVAQRLVRRVCPHCAEPHIPSSKELQVLGLSVDRVDLSAYRKGRGCHKCSNTGFLGREAIVEVMEIDPKIKQMIHEGTFSQLKPYLQETNFSSFRISAIDKVTRGITTIEEIVRILPKSALSEESFAKKT